MTRAVTFPFEFLACHDETGRHEGLLSDHPNDPGGRTMRGVTQVRYNQHRDSKSLPRRDVLLISKPEWLDIYYNGYWLKAGCDKLHPGVDLAIYDAAVNSGPGRARRWLLASTGSTDHSVTVKRICQKRLSFVQGLRTWKTFGRGWSRRIADVQATGVAWALTAMKLEASMVAEGLQDEATSKSIQSAKQNKGAGGAGGGAVMVGGGEQVANTAADQIITVLAWGSVAALVLAAFYLVWRARQNADQADAYNNASKVI